LNSEPEVAGRQQFSSGFVIILAMIGVAVGLGNVWRFPSAAVV